MLPWYDPAKSQAPQNWKDKWAKLRARFDRIIDECSPFQCVLVQKRIPEYAPISPEFPVIVHGFEVVSVLNGLRSEPSRLLTPTWDPLDGLFPVKSVQGKPMLNKRGAPQAFRFGLSRRLAVYAESGWRSGPCPQAALRLMELARDGTSLLYQLPANIALSLWRNWPAGFSKTNNSGESLWLDALFELSWQQEPGSSVHAQRSAWVGNCSFGLMGHGLFPRLPDWLAQPSDTSVPHESGYPMAYYSKLSDLARASVAAIDELLERETVTPNYAQAPQGRTPSPITAASPIKDQSMSATKRNKVFVSYSHKDKKLFEEFKTMLAPAIQRGIVDVWDDTKIQPGQQWKAEIEKALAGAKVGVLLVSNNFLASEFISKKELPPLLNAAKADGATIFWVCLGPSLYEQTEIQSYQAAHDVSKPLSKLSKPQREAVLQNICKRLLQVVANPQ